MSKHAAERLQGGTVSHMADQRGTLPARTQTI
ncbi:hypothetical protein Olsu_0799 [Olsenella uli DSM 7084]|uniref:Uncharacterized protein n=1 Tax=Olsenella uli (strain ATCC 49627 / DSM 7084 / CCUG 31166 / CIP 109912 / JCM 12494 / LMG 11480 / NCIMB 702895 / VPI D76D-27C) TaxID=633147 RepID=E1QZU8_OLSUV|nr:hypothetical protein Olsu_0799 [Olsenella uli DSM 7084]